MSKYLSICVCVLVISFLCIGLDIKYNVRSSKEKVLSAKTYTSPISYTLRPSQPDINVNEGKTIKKDRFTTIILPGTVAYQAYLSLGIVPKTNPIQIGKYWQVSNIYDVCLKSYHNSAKILDPLRNSVVSISFVSNDLRTSSGDNLPEASLKIVKTTDNGISWTMLKTSVVDSENKTVAALSDVCGGFMLVSGFVDPRTLYNYKAID